MSLIPLDTRVALAAQAPQIDFNQLTRNTLDLYDNVKQRGQQGTLSRLLAQNTGLDGQMDLSGALLSAQTDPKQAYQANTVTTLAGLIQQQNAAKYKAQQDAIKFEADTAKTNAETGKLSQEAGEKEFGIIQNKMNSVRQVWQMAAKSGSAKDVLMGLNSAKVLGAISPEAYEENVNALNTMKPEDVMRFAGGLALAGDKDQAKYLFETPDNILDNKTSVANNTATVGASIHNTDVVAKTAKAKLVQDGEQFNKGFNLDTQKQWFDENKPVAFGVDINGRKYRSLADGRNVYEKDDQGNFIIEQTKGSGAMSATMQKELIQTDDAISSGQAVISGLQDALKLNDSSYDGFTASPRAKTAGFIGYDDERATNTVLIDNIATGNALDALKSTFGAAPTEGERKILLELQGSVNLPAPQRKVIWDRGIAAAKKRIEYNQGKADAIRNGSFTSTTYKPYMGESPPQGGVGGNAANGGSSGKPNAMTFFKPPQ